ncbi:MAG: hypothetical protein ABNH53_02110 [Henriciella sp.]|jgi:hypothetical protein
MTDSYFSRRGIFANGQWSLFLVAGLILLMLAMRAVDVFEGTVPDNDDLLRLQQVRDLMAGQAWFNVDQARMLTPEGGEMHWSRLPDIFLASIIYVTQPLLGQAHAEMLAMSVWPLVLLTWTLAMLVTVLRRLGVGLAGQVVGLIFFALSGAIYNFWPGRIDHHNLTVALTLTGFAAAISANLSLRSGVIAAVCIAAMLSVAIETLPYAAALILTFGLFWIVRGHNEALRLAAFGFALIVFSSIFYLADAPGWGARRMVCDAYGNSHWAGMLGGGTLLGAIGVFGGNLDGWGKRLIAGGVAGGVTLGLVAWVNPACLGDPYADVSDQVRLAWLSVVGEARNLGRLLADEPSRAVWQVGFVFSGLVATAIMVLKAPSGNRLPTLALAVMMVLSALATVWQIRGVTFSHVFAVIATAWFVGAYVEYWLKTRGSLTVIGLFAGIIAFSPMMWAQLAESFRKPSPYAVSDKPYKSLCLDPQSYADIADMPPMKVLTPIDLGMSVLVRTPHSVFAGPYHRNVKGIEQVTGIFMGPPEAGRADIAKLGATHVLYCEGLHETTRYGMLRPDSFATQLNNTDIPDWLEPVDSKIETDGIIRLYRVKAE